jgi:ribosomal protein S24E
MELEVIERKDSPLLSRVEVSFRVTHPKESTPKRSDIREELAIQLNVKKNCVVIDNMKAVFGKSETIGFAKIYSSDKLAKDIERKHILIRNKLESGGPQKEKPKKEAEPEPKKELKDESSEDSAKETKEETKEETKSVAEDESGE